MKELGEKSPYEALQAWRESSRWVDAAAKALATAELEATDAARLAEMADEAVQAASKTLKAAQQMADRLRSASDASVEAVGTRQRELSDAHEAESTARRRHHEVVDLAYGQEGYPERPDGDR